MTNNVHLTDKHADGHGSVSLSAHHFTGPGYEAVADVAPTAKDLLAKTDDGWWVFDVIQSHRLVYGSLFPCSRHDHCESDAFVTQLAQPVWERIRSAGVTDDRVFAELGKLHAAWFEGAS